MSEPNDNVTAFEKSRRLSDAIREVKNATADRDDVVIEMREAERMRLELLANELAPIIAEVPADTDLFDFAVSSGLQPRFWIDAVAHVAMGRDKRTFRFLKDTRLGRVVLAETPDIKAVANAVTRYLAERIVERQRLMEGDIVEHGQRHASGASVPENAIAIADARAKAASQMAVAQGDPESERDSARRRETSDSTATIIPPTGKSPMKSLLGGLALAIAGAAVGLAVAALFYWEKLGLADLLRGTGS